MEAILEKQNLAVRLSHLLLNLCFSTSSSGLSRGRGESETGKQQWQTQLQSHHSLMSCDSRTASSLYCSSLCRHCDPNDNAGWLDNAIADCNHLSICSRRVGFNTNLQYRKPFCGTFHMENFSRTKIRLSRSDCPDTATPLDPAVYVEV